MSSPYEYVAEVLKFHPQGWDHSYWAGASRRVGNKRRTDICRHQHGSREEGQLCADNLARIRNKLGGAA